jgi:hypothetical protein
MIPSWLLAGLLLLTTIGYGQTGPATDFFIDPVGKLYLLLEDESLVTANPLGENFYAFYDSTLGRPDRVDVTNPFQILLYYADYGKVIVLDRTLSELDRIDLFANPAIRQPGAIARSYDNGIWVFDSWDYRLLRLNERGEVDQRTNDLRLELDYPGEPRDIFVGRSSIMLYFAEENRLAVFTNFGQFVRWVELPAAETVSFQSPFLLGIDGQQAWYWEPAYQRATELGKLPDKLIGQGRIRTGPRGYLSLDPETQRLLVTDFPKKN